MSTAPKTPAPQDATRADPAPLGAMTTVTSAVTSAVTPAVTAAVSSALSAGAIAAGCAASASHVSIEVVAETGSTNVDLLARVDTLRGPVLLIAEAQTAGRGRAGRTWLSTPGATLTFSLAWRFKGPLQRIAGLPLAVGVALAETMNSLSVPVQLKWPNDLLRGGKKLGGILVETQQSAGGELWAVIGAGINLVMPDELEAQIGRAVAAAPWLAQMDRNALMAALASRLAAVLAEFDDTGFAAFSERWNRLHAWQGQHVSIVDHGATLNSGRAVGVDDIGRLQLDTAQGRVDILSGDVSLRLAAS